MLTIGQLAAYAGVTVRAVRHYHQIGLLPEPERDASGYRRYGAPAVVALIKIRTLADAGVPLGRIADMLAAGPADFAEAIAGIDSRLRDEIDRLERSRRQVAQLVAGDSLVLPQPIVAYLDRLREIGASERVLAGERDGWILVAARWPDQVLDWIPSKFAQLEDPRLVRLYRVLSALMETAETDDALLREAAGLLVELAEDAEAAGGLDAAAEERDDTSYALLDDLADAADKRAERLRELMRERGWDGWTRMRRLPKPAR
ncbi:MerR family transcriptional regulator [Actinoplanes oblitus]|uniref:MerR family transcriptional regulator n=1 Tax=Actinoplanes oblitus TaxID=3040509 RepID=A0ABY8W762_9ACTN|nr:MerR family transcriptional regulator [Actinoplanes oblitus]WIM92986.1 MerR family transcriptional regulator [Actinoplanes oblitus]